MGEITDYVHRVQYYETDKMGITHHSNYIRWMEEARVDFLAKAGWDYGRLEEMGIISAVVNVTCDYKRPTAFSDDVTIRASIVEFRGFSLKFAYEMTGVDGVTVCTGTTSHAFLNADGRPVNLKRTNPELFEAFGKLVAEESDR